VGAGVFLVEALEQVADRTLVSGWSDNKPLEKRIDDIVAQGKERFAAHSMAVSLHAATAVRMHILENCLYGLDLDPIGVEIARHALLAKAFGRERPFPDIVINVRVGNSLMGECAGNPDSATEMELDRFHARAHFGAHAADSSGLAQWRKKKGLFHWPLEYPEVFGKDRRGFDAIIGNPPYEIVSVKESGIEDRKADQRYFRRIYRTCSGKINTYRLMLERGLNLLSAKGALGFIMPATIIADSTATELRRMVLDQSEIVHAALIPEKARIFQNVTQALLILVLRKGRKTTNLQSVSWNGEGTIPEKGGVEIPRALIDAAGLRIPVLRSEDEKALLELVSRHPPFRGADRLCPIGRVHQGEINLTVQREFITTQETDFPLIRGEHVAPFRVAHPSSRPGRLDWVVPEYAQKRMADQPSGTARGRPWENERIVLGRVVNMATSRRLKAAAVPAGVFLGDMTNFVSELTAPRNYLLGLLNSRVLNWRLKITSTNNYLSAAEIEALPIPRIPHRDAASSELTRAQEVLKPMLNDESLSLSACPENIEKLLGPQMKVHGEAILPRIIEWLVEEILRSESASEARKITLTNLLDALVLKLYGIDPCPGLIQLLELS
jgi:Alw26I/Eco31I/Esp3I family type II restriction m6 adenine DNA methyltransferase